MYEQARWVRLERYSRWKQGRFRLDHLPNDVTLCVMSFLCSEDMCSLLNALYSIPMSNITSRSLIRLVPMELRHEWIHGAACDDIRRTLYTIGDIAMFHASGCHSVRAHVNWSIFSGPITPVSLCVYRWSRSQTAIVDVNEVELRRLIRRAGTTGCTSVTLCLHRYLWWNGSWIVHPEPCYRQSLIVFPHFLASESLHACISWRDRLVRDACFRNSSASCLFANAHREL